MKKIYQKLALTGESVPRVVKTEDAGDGYYSIISKCNGLYLDVYGAMANNGTQMQIYEGNESNAQKFKLEKIETEIIGEQTVEDGTYYFSITFSVNLEIFSSLTVLSFSVTAFFISSLKLFDR